MPAGAVIIKFAHSNGTWEKMEVLILTRKEQAFYVAIKWLYTNKEIKESELNVQLMNKTSQKFSTI